MDIKDGEWAVVFATLLGPILAVQAQKFVEALRERRNVKHAIFSKLMATRKARLSAEHVQALNMIDVAFYGIKFFGFRVQWQSEKLVVEKWKEYLDQLNIELTEQNYQVLMNDRENIFSDLLAAIATAVNFHFDKVTLKRGAYSPIHHGQVEDESNRLRSAMLQVFEGKAALQMDVSKFPFNEQAAANNQMMVEQLLHASAGGSIRVSVIEPNAIGDKS